MWLSLKGDLLVSGFLNVVRFGKGTYVVDWRSARPWTGGCMVFVVQRSRQFLLCKFSPGFEHGSTPSIHLASQARRPDMMVRSDKRGD